MDFYVLWMNEYFILIQALPPHVYVCVSCVFVCKITQKVVDGL